MNIYKAHNKRKTLVAYSCLPPVYRITERIVFITLVILRRRLVTVDNPFHPFFLQN